MYQQLLVLTVWLAMGAPSGRWKLPMACNAWVTPEPAELLLIVNELLTWNVYPCTNPGTSSPVPGQEMLAGE